MMKRIFNLLSGPRNISTALMYSFAQHPDFVVVDEPFYGHYLRQVSDRSSHPMDEEIQKAMPHNKDQVIERLEKLAQEKLVFSKSMAHHCIEEEPKYLLDWTNIILIRHPKKLIHSFSKVIPDPTLEAIGIKKAFGLYQFLKRHKAPVLVIESDELLRAPEHYLTQMCGVLGFDFDRSMLRWPKGGNPADGMWAPYWYGNVHQSTGFLPQESREITLSEPLELILSEALPYYQALREEVLINTK